MAISDMYILDTNILVHFVRGSELWSRIRDEYEPFTRDVTPLFCVVSEGELRSLSIQWNWGTRKLDQLEFCLGFFESYTIDRPRVLRAYATIDAYGESIGRKMGKNDVWIAATAAVTGATLVTTDRDFDHLVPRFLKRDWIDPDTK